MLALLAVTASCEKDTLPTNFAPDVVTGGTDEIYRTGVRYVKGTVNNPANFIVEEYGIQYSLYDNFAVPTEVASTNMDSNGNFSVALEGLDPGTKFYYRTYAFGGYNTVYGLKREFSTVTTSAPTFGDNTVSNIDFTSFDIEMSYVETLEELMDFEEDLFIAGLSAVKEKAFFTFMNLVA